ncbi:Hemocyte protein-glutamine gamma-glutamyltransferase-like protein, partial [Dinothrombium tinctorium]
IEANHKFKIYLDSKTNALAHHTDKYHLLDASLFLRRGFSFSVRIKCEPVFNVINDQIRVDITYDSRIGTYYKSKSILVDGAKTSDDWRAVLDKIENEMVFLKIYIPVDAAFGFYKIDFKFKTKGKSEILVGSEVICLLFNPWHEDDVVYLADEKLRQEFVINDIGEIYVGGLVFKTAKAWEYGQFDEYVVPVVSTLLENYGLNSSQMADPVIVARAISSIANDDENNGILSGSWKNDYYPYKNPSYWSSSLEIIKRYYESGFEPVRYAQCWVFAALATTMARSIGIPARPVTCFGARHDTDESLTIDQFFDKEGDIILPMKGDLSWNFHVWTEVWMARRDLPHGFGGWQAIDGTPQEKSDNIFQAGPVPVYAVKIGAINYPYDGPFVFGEVDAISVHWHRDESTELGWRRVVTSEQETQLWTKKPNSMNNSKFWHPFKNIEDITSTYKHNWNSDERRMARLNARKQRGLKMLFEDDFSKTNVDYILFVNRARIGENLRIRVEIINRNNRTILVTSMQNVKSVFYNGAIAHKVAKNRTNFSVEPFTGKFHETIITPQQYLDKLVPFEGLTIFATVMVDSIGIWSQIKTVNLAKPNLEFNIKGRMRVGETIYLTLTFDNPLNTSLSEGSFEIDVAGKRIVRKASKPINPKQAYQQIESIKLRREGRQTISATFNSKDLKGIYGFVIVNVNE